MTGLGWRLLRDLRSAETSSQRASKSMAKRCQLLLADRFRLSRHGAVLAGVRGEGEMIHNSPGTEAQVQSSRLLASAERSRPSIMCF